MNTEYANMTSGALACLHYIRLWIVEASTIGLADPLLIEIDKIMWQASRHVYSFEKTEPNF